jgi:nucleotide-binding universal stress UspA family protein
MQNFKKTLLPVDFPHVTLRVIHQAATLAHHFHSDLVMLHVVIPASQNASGPEAGADLAGWDLLQEIVRTAQESMDQTLGPEHDGFTTQRVLLKGDPPQTIVAAAQQEKADLIMMPPHGFTFDQFLPGSVSGTECPVWTSAYVEELPAHKFAIRNVRCAVDFRPHSRRTVLWAERIATEFGAHLTLAEVTSSVDFCGRAAATAMQVGRMRFSPTPINMWQNSNARRV